VPDFAVTEHAGAAAGGLLTRDRPLGLFWASPLRSAVAASLATSSPGPPAALIGTVPSGVRGGTGAAGVAPDRMAMFSDVRRTRSLER
jgi:hypothetical protein